MRDTIQEVRLAVAVTDSVFLHQLVHTLQQLGGAGMDNPMAKGSLTDVVGRLLAINAQGVEHNVVYRLPDMPAQSMLIKDLHSHSCNLLRVFSVALVLMCKEPFIYHGYKDSNKIRFGQIPAP
jgi:hypothetical protein